MEVSSDLIGGYKYVIYKNVKGENNYKFDLTATFENEHLEILPPYDYDSINIKK